MLIRNSNKRLLGAAALLLGGSLLMGGTLLCTGSPASAATLNTVQSGDTNLQTKQTITAQQGDTFWLLSMKYGIPLQSLLDANPDVDPLNIYTGLKLNIPQAVQTVTAQQGDTFWLLSQKYGVPLQSLLDVNPDVDPLNIYTGLKLNIPLAASTVSTLSTQGETVLAGSNPSSSPASSSSASSSPKAPSESEAKAVQAITTATGESLEFVKVLDVKATAYSDSPEENGWGPVDYFGNPLKLGTIAVDPKVIPFGTKVYITGYNFDGLPAGGLIATATDSGSAIKGNRIDIFVPGKRSYVATFGVQNVKVYILK